jgi:hypothetical protein
MFNLKQQFPFIMTVAPIALYQKMQQSSGVYTIHLFPFYNSMTVIYILMGVVLWLFFHRDHHSYLSYGQVISIQLHHKTPFQPMSYHLIYYYIQFTHDVNIWFPYFPTDLKNTGQYFFSAKVGVPPMVNSITYVPHLPLVSYSKAQLMTHVLIHKNAGQIYDDIID